MIHSELPRDDRRVQRTRKLIQAALIELTIQKGFAAVTVSDITERAEVNRATFYRHYQDKFDLLDQYAQEVYQLLDTADADSPIGSKIVASETSGLVKLFEHIRTHAKFYRVMLSKDGDPGFAEKIRHYIQKRLRQSLPDELSGKLSADLYLSYVSSASVGVVLWWLEHDIPYSPIDMAALCIRLSVADMRVMLDQANLSQQEK